MKIDEICRMFPFLLSCISNFTYNLWSILRFQWKDLITINVKLYSFLLIYEKEPCVLIHVTEHKKELIYSNICCKKRILLRDFSFLRNFIKS